MDGFRLLRAYLLCKADSLVLLAGITNEDMNTSRTWTIGLLRLLQDLFMTACDVNLGSVGLQSLSYH